MFTMQLMCTSRPFISTQDALAVAARYLASAIVCRIVLMYELSCLRTIPEGLDRTDKLTQWHLADVKRYRLRLEGGYRYQLFPPSFSISHLFENIKESSTVSSSQITGRWSH